MPAVQTCLLGEYIFVYYKKVQEAWKCYTAEKEWKIFCFQKYINWSPEFLNAYKVVIIRDDIILSNPLFTQRQPGLAPAPRDDEF